MSEPKFKVGQVVFINVDYYKTKEHRGEQFQKITAVWPWTWQEASKNNPQHSVAKTKGWGYSFANGDKCNEKWIEPLSKRQAGGARG